jgi:hypothetical protein
MRLTCALCGRLTIPAVMIGNQAVGPSCAKRAGLLQSKPRKGSSIVILKRKQEKNDCETMDLFEDIG